MLGWDPYLFVATGFFILAMIFGSVGYTRWVAEKMRVAAEDRRVALQIRADRQAAASPEPNSDIDEALKEETS